MESAPAGSRLSRVAEARGMFEQTSTPVAPPPRGSVKKMAPLSPNPPPRASTPPSTTAGTGVPSGRPIPTPPARKTPGPMAPVNADTTCSSTSSTPPVPPPALPKRESVYKKPPPPPSSGLAHSASAPASSQSSRPTPPSAPASTAGGPPPVKVAPKKLNPNLIPQDLASKLSTAPPANPTPTPSTPSNIRQSYHQPNSPPPPPSNSATIPPPLSLYTGTNTSGSSTPTGNPPPPPPFQQPRPMTPNASSPTSTPLGTPPKNELHSSKEDSKGGFFSSLFGGKKKKEKSHGDMEIGTPFNVTHNIHVNFNTTGKSGHKEDDIESTEC
eukprot:TRINITY_DN3360_c0_g1_i2.p1 TRINITY_DN3360_c0_g1~~TRINITY_DN3360_c0_g1_i2.p1  ORF type:complete len:327 (+),score=169.04 TRINITY_DN3360_c0_g1_i2:251-1231(+)